MCVAGRLCGRAAEREWCRCCCRRRWPHCRAVGPGGSGSPALRRHHGGFWTTLRCVDVGVKEDGRRGVDGAQRAEDIGVLPARLGRRRDVPVRRARRVQVHRPEGGDAESVVAARLQPRCGGRIGGAARVSGVAAVARVGANSGAPPPVAGWRRPGVCGSGRVPRAPQHLPIVSAGLVVLNSARSTMLVGSSCAMATTKVVPPPSQAAYTVGIGVGRLLRRSAITLAEEETKDQAPGIKLIRKNPAAKAREDRKIPAHPHQLTHASSLTRVFVRRMESQSLCNRLCNRHTDARLQSC